MENPAKHLISHEISQEPVEVLINKIATRIKQQGDKPYITVSAQLELLHQLSQFEFGIFLIRNRGINGYWTHYMLTHPLRSESSQTILSPLETFILDSAPTMLATQQRFMIFLEENQKMVFDGAKLACVPCGLMGELLYLNYEGIERIDLIGIDYDQDSLFHAKKQAKKKNLSPFVHLHQTNAWDIESEETYDLISSNGLTIYEPDDKKVMDLYGIFYRALKQNGKLVTSFLTPPPNLTDDYEWDMVQIDPEALNLQKIIFVDILEAKWQCFRSSEQVKSQLQQAGFSNIEFIYDSAKLFPTVVAYKC